MMSSADEAARPAFRSEMLRECGAAEGDLAELLSYTETPWRKTGDEPLPDFPLPDEPHVAAWLDYACEAEASGAWEALKERFAQLRFPIRAGMSEDADYRMATRRGVTSFGAFPFGSWRGAPPPRPMGSGLFGSWRGAPPARPMGSGLSGLTLNRPDALTLAVHPTMAGRLAVLVAGDREDFVSLVRAFSGRNEPVPVPDSMGACIVTGLNNWDRIAAYRREWERKQTEPPGEDAWAEEFARLVPRKELYQDRFILLSRGAYSATPASALELEGARWLDLSLTIRREHEFTHYFTYRVFGSMRNHVLDELLGDFVGLVRATGRYRSDWALRFMGLESYPRYRAGGRLESYLGEPPLSEPATRVVQSLTVRTAQNLEVFAARHRDLLPDLTGLARITVVLAGLSLEELASPEMVDRASSRLGARA